MKNCCGNANKASCQYLNALTLDSILLIEIEPIDKTEFKINSVSTHIKLYTIYYI